MKLTNLYFERMLIESEDFPYNSQQNFVNLIHAGIANNTLVLIYNDHIKLSDRDAETGKSKALRDTKKSLVYKYTFDLETGESKRTALIKESNQGGTYLAPKVFFRNDDNSIIVWGRYKKTQKFGHLIFSN